MIIQGYPNPLSAQQSLSEKTVLLNEKFEKQALNDTAYINGLHKIAQEFVYLYPDSLLPLLKSTENLSRKINYKEGMVEMLTWKGEVFGSLRNYDSAIYFLDNALKIALQLPDKDRVSSLLNRLGSVYINKGDYAVAFEKFYESLKIAEAINNKERSSAVLNNLANIFYFQKKYDEAEDYYLRALSISEELKDTLSIAIGYNNLGEIYLVKKDYSNALRYLKMVSQTSRQLNHTELMLASMVALAQTYAELDSVQVADQLFDGVISDANNYHDALYAAYGYLGKAKLKYRQNNYGVALSYADSLIAVADTIGQKNLMMQGHELLAKIYESMGDYKKAFNNFKLFKSYADSLNNLETARSAAMQEASYNYSKKELQFERKALEQRWLIFSAFAGILSLGIILFIINRNRRRLNYANRDLQQKNKEIEQQKLTLEDTLNKLQSAQAQLIHAEKMASLGELTAGVAHEIQNPLNFVNNFSEVSREMIEEVEDELQKGNPHEALSILKEIWSNLEKIEFHGKRADGIVKSMLYHSRTSSGKRAITVLNELCDEYVKLSIHGLRAKDKSFNIKVEESFDPEVGKVDLMPQEIGRVLLNLLNNAFFACNERLAMSQKEVGSMLAEKGKGDNASDNYVPMVKISTKRLGNWVQLVVEDNAGGISPEISSKIFQPFFTTKPTGSGTGLGLSISYDIITKGHSGEISLESVPNDFTRFVIKLPADRASVNP
jgi:signal transduction histidine kinase/Tfp pilus assembly protein PilF